MLAHAPRTARLALALSLAIVTACGDPLPGDPCDPDDAPLIYDHPDPIPSFCPRFDIPVPEPCRLVCTGPAGCDPDAEFRWAVDYDGPGVEWCDCDGRTQRNHQRLATGAWRWYGKCDSPCEDVFYETALPEAEWNWGVDRVRPEVAPICTDCTQAVRSDGVCRNADGLEMPGACCGCYLDVDLQCRSEFGDEFAISPRCCDGMTP